jgi:acyl dehydratase
MSEAPGTISLHELQQRTGQILGVSAWYTIDQPLIDRFAELTRDRQFIHVDPVRARAESPFGGTIAHGFLILSLLSDMAAQSLPVCEGIASGVNYGFDRIRFVAPVPSNSRVRTHFTLGEVTLRSASQVLIRYTASVEIEGGNRPALTADWLSLLFLHTR